MDYNVTYSFFSSEFQINRSNSFPFSPQNKDRTILIGKVRKGQNIATLFWYALYAGYLLAVMDSVKLVEARKRRHKEMAGAICQPKWTRWRGSRPAAKKGKLGERTGKAVIII
jgi:hypothetical protein